MPTQAQIVDLLSTAHLHADLKGRSVRGGLMTLSSQGAQFVMQSVSTVVLARLLTPADFGLVAMVTAITGLGQAFADFGLSEATIQRQEINHEQVSTLFWINVGIGLALMLAAITLAPIMAWFYHEPRLKAITFVVSFTFLFGGLRVQHNALLKRQMRFRALALRDIAAYALAVPLAIIMAAGSRILGHRGSAVDVEFHPDGAFLVAGEMGSGPAPARRQCRLDDILRRQSGGLLRHRQREPQCG